MSILGARVGLCRGPAAAHISVHRTSRSPLAPHPVRRVAIARAEGQDKPEGEGFEFGESRVEQEEAPAGSPGSPSSRRPRPFPPPDLAPPLSPT